MQQLSGGQARINMTLSHRHKMILISALGILASGIFAIISAPISGPDTIQYDRLGYNLALGNGFSLSAQAPYEPTMFREPAYPVFLAAIYRIFGHRPETAVFAQMIMHAFAALLSYLIARHAFSEKSAFISGIAVALFPTLANASAYILSETMFTFLLCLGLYVILRTLEKKTVRLFILSGILFGLLALTRIIAIFLPFLLAVIALIVALIKKKFAFRVTAGLGIFLVVFMLIISVWSIRNKALFDTYAMTVRSGEALWSRAAKLEYSPKDILTTACYSVSESLGAKLFPDLGSAPERYLYRDLDKAAVLRASYRKSGLTEPQADALLKKEAMEKIAMRPFKYLSYTFIESIKMSAFTYLPLLNEPRIVAYFDRIANGRFLLSLMKGSVRMLAIPVLILCIMGIVRNLAIWDRWILLFSVMVYFNVLCSLLDAIGRYGVPLIPFYCIFAAAVLHQNRSDPAKGPIKNE